MKILFLDVPGLHLGYLGCYGNDWVGTPNLDRLACESVVFDRHYFDVEQPEPTAWTGHQGFIVSHSPPLPYPALPPITLRSILEQHHLNCASIQLGSEISLEKYQDALTTFLSSESENPGLRALRFPPLAPPWDLPEDLLNSYCEEDDEPWPNPPHGPLENPDDLPRLQNTYAAVVTYIDARLGEIVDSLRAQNRLDDLLLCVTSSCGLPLGEHGHIGYTQPWPHEEFVHLPLLVRLPHGEHGGLRLNALTQPVDLFPTFLEFLGIETPPCHGYNLWPLIRGEVNQVRQAAFTALRRGAAEELALRTLDWAYLLPINDSSRRPQLFVKPEDRWEVNNVRQHHLELAEEMEKTLRSGFIDSRSREPASANR